MRRVIFITLTILTSSAISSAINAEDPVSITTLVLEGDNVDGIGNITSIENLDVNNSGSWLVEADTDFGNTNEDLVLLKDGVVFFREGFGGLDSPSEAIIDFFDSVTLNNSGQGGFNFFIDPFPSDEDSGVYIDGNVVVQESDISTAAEFSAGTPFIGFFDVKINDNAKVAVIASIDDPNINSSVDRAIMLMDNTTQIVVAKEGDVLQFQEEVVEDFGTGPHEMSVNNNDEILYIAELAGNADVDHAIYLDQTLVAQEGSPSPAEGRNYEFLSGRGNDLNNNGDYIFKARLSGSSDADDALILNDTVFKQEGEPAGNGFLLTRFGSPTAPICLSDNGDVLWFGEWDDPDTTRNKGLFFNNILLVQEGETEIGGLLVEDIWDGTDAFAMSDNGQFVIFEATLAGGLNGAFLISNPAGTVVAPTELNVFRGNQIGGSLADVAASDDQRILFNPGFTINSMEPPVWLIFESSLTTSSPNNLNLTMESQAGTPGITATLEAWNWSTETYDKLDVSETAFGNDETVSVSLTSNIEDYVGQTGQLRGRAGWQKTGFTINFPWEVRIDQFVWVCN